MKDKARNEPSGDSRTASREADADVVAKSRELALRLPALGHITWLCCHTQIHRNLFVQDLEWRVFPPVLLGQYKLVMDSKVGGLPTAYASWALLSEEVEDAYRSTHKLRPNDWRSGENLWLVDFVTPFGGAAVLLEELCYQVHKDREIKLMYPVGGGDPREVTLSHLLGDLRGIDTADGRPRSVPPNRH